MVLLLLLSHDGSYGNMGCQSSKGGIQNLLDFLPKINKENYCIWSMSCRYHCLGRVDWYPAAAASAIQPAYPT